MIKSDLERTLEIPEPGLSQLGYVLMQSVAGGATPESIARGLGCTPEEIDSIIAEINGDNLLFDRAVTILRLDAAGNIIDRDFGWNDLERLALEKLRRVIPKISDPDVLTRVATAANRAKRSNDPTSSTPGNGVSSPSILPGGNLGTLHLDITHRVVKQLTEQNQRIIDGDVVKVSRVGGLEMLKLADIRLVADADDQSGRAEAAREREEIHVDPELLRNLFPKEAPEL